MFTALLLTYSISAFVLQMAGIGSAAVLYLTAMPLFVALVLEAAIRGGSSPVSMWVYALGQLTPLLTGTQMTCTIFDVFVPLVRSGAFAFCLRRGSMSVHDLPDMGTT
jgi:hypothetical protein